MVFKVEKIKDFTVMSNYHLRDKNLSYKAKGLLSYMLSLPEDWDYSLNGLVSCSKENIKAIKSILNELKKYEYVEINQGRKANGHFEYEYIIREVPKYLINNFAPYTQSGNTVVGKTAKEQQINTNIQITNEQTDKVDKTKNNIFEDNHNFLTIDLIDRKYISKNDTDIYNYDVLFKKLLNDYKVSDILIILHYIIPKVLDRNFIDENGDVIANKFGYLKASILNNIDRLKNNQLIWDDELGWFTDIDKSY
ncbi:MAG: hypothetical protein OSJ70_01380 [Bacilli bacterium]|nr:hypothetical protein [Bacilli bacterium]